MVRRYASPLLQSHPRDTRFLTGNALLTTNEFPSDLDTTSLALTILDNIDEDTRNTVMERMLSHVDTDGITQVQWFLFDKTFVIDIVIRRILILIDLDSTQ